MAGEIQFSYQAGKTTYFLVRNSVGLIWNTSNAAFEAYATGTYGDYVISASQQGTASAYYTGTFPAAIIPGTYSITAKDQVGGSPAETDPTVAVGNEEWNGSGTIPLSDLATSGQVAGMTIQAVRGHAISNFQFKIVSSIDHITPVTSGLISGYIARDNGSFVPLQSGLSVAGYTEIGLGWYRVNLTSGDMNANTAALEFIGLNVSGAGGISDPRSFAFLLNNTSG